ncbi:MAG: hypothetical protein ABFD16_22315 [Thermoguttaceae bacterium]
MSANRWIKQLRREAARNPAKAGVLGLLVVVALWFWAPLVWGLVGSREESSQPSPTGSPLATRDVSSPAPASTATAAPAATWQQLVEWRKRDPRTTAADMLKTRRDPFHAIPSAVVQEEVKAVPVVQVVITPEQLGLRLSSTVVGSDRRVALINGRIYREGQVLKCGKEAQEILFRLAEVHSRHVVLEREGHRFELAIPEKKLSDRIQLSGSPGR